MRSKALVLGVFILLAGSVGVWQIKDQFFASSGGESGGESSRGGAGASPGGGRPVVVEAEPVTIGPIAREVTAVGTLVSNESVVLRPEISGRIAKLSFEEGQRVSKGQVLVTLDDSALAADLEQARANLALAQANNGRAAKLFSQGAGTGRAKDEATASLRVSIAKTELARAVLDKTVLVAPFDGIAGLRNVSAGAYLSAGQDIVNLESIDPIKVEFRVPELYLAVVKTGQPISITADAFAGQTFAGTVYAINPAIDERGRAIVIRARVPNPDLLLKPGLFVRLSLIVDETAKAVQVPEQALVPRGEALSVFKIIDGKAVPAKVTAGKRRKGMVEITQGLEEGDVIVTAGQIKLRPGMAVSVPGDTVAPAKPGA